MKKIILLITMLVVTTGCASSASAVDVVEDYLSSYQNLEYQVLVDMETVVNSEEAMSDEQKEIYRKILKKQYEDFDYLVVGEYYNNDDAVVTVNITVYDYYSASLDAGEYLKNNAIEFYNEYNEYDASLYMDYKLSVYKSTTKTVDHSIEFNLIKEDGIWKILTVSNEVLEKIHGIYNYSVE